MRALRAWLARAWWCLAQMSRASVEGEERRAKILLAPELRRHLELIGRVYNLVPPINRAFEGRAITGMPLPLKVRLVLLGRLADDLVCVGRLCEIGYSGQGCTVAASIFEVAHTIAYVGNDKRARAWSSHNDPTRPFKPVAEIVQMNVNAAGFQDPEERSRSEYRLYRQLCWLKHANPLLMDFRDINSWEAHGTLDYGPNTSEEGIRRSWFALQHAGRLGLMAMASIFTKDLDTQTQQSLVIPVGECTRILDDLNVQAKDRWGTEMPFQGRW